MKMRNQSRLKKLNRGNFNTFFEQVFVQGEYCTYDFNWFLFSTVQDLAHKARIVIKYCPPGSHGYRMYGDAAFRVFPLDDFYGAEGVEYKELDQPSFTFDPAMLMI